MLIDYHVHNHFSPDSDADTAEILKNLQKMGVKEVCFTNHAEWFDDASASGRGVFDLYEALRRFESIHWEIEQLRPKFPKIKIKVGVEITYNPKILKGLEQFLNEANLDFVIGSVHEIDDFIINSSKHCHNYFKDKTESQAYDPYFEQLGELVQWGQFSVVGHLDVIKKYGVQYYGPFEPKKYKKPILKVLQLMKEKGLGIELNAGSLHQRCQELFPHPAILQWALEVGLEHFTLSSDSHTAEEAGIPIKETLEIAKSVGLKTVSTYDQRIPKKHAL